MILLSHSLFAWLALILIRVLPTVPMPDRELGFLRVFQSLYQEKGFSRTLDEYFAREGN